MNFKDYKPWVQSKLSPKFHSDPEDNRESELRTVIEDFIKVGNQLDVLKKNKFYGRVKGHPKHVESGVEVRPSDSNFMKESEDEQLLHAIIGMATETVEMLEAIYASKWKGEEFDTVNFFEEIGDLEFYRSIPFNNLNWTEERVRETNYFKLEKRYPVGYTDKDATERDLSSERTILVDGLDKEDYIYMDGKEIKDNEIINSLNPKDYHIESQWSYGVTGERPKSFSGDTLDWSQTFLTKINECCAFLYMASPEKERENTTIISHVSLKFLFVNLEYYNHIDQSIGKSYSVEYVTNIEEDSVEITFNNKTSKIKVKI
jgi:hypothetical protein|tara:strand:- start:9306 stop:10256 length:951 start_codon:yes stop_codon:yes gene_type:complete